MTQMYITEGQADQLKYLASSAVMSTKIRNSFNELIKSGHPAERFADTKDWLLKHQAECMITGAHFWKSNNVCRDCKVKRAFIKKTNKPIFFWPGGAKTMRPSNPY